MRITCRISGRVQMVMYRDFATRTARKFGIVGEVHNEPDGTVSLIAEGDEETLKRYVVALTRGSLLASVERVDVVWAPATGSFMTFTIRY